MKRVAILISGGGSNMVKLCESMQGDHPARPVLVASNRPDAGGLRKATDMGVPVAKLDHRAYAERSEFDEALGDMLDSAAPDVICFAGFMRILSVAFVARFEGRMLNIHPSLLPKYQGLNTHARALQAGDVEAGCTVHQVTAALDDGPILGQARVPIDPGETIDSLAKKVLVQEHNLYPTVLRRFIDGNKTPILLT